MLRKYLMLPAALAIGSLMMGASSVQAQHRTGGGSAHVSSAHVVHSGNVGHVGAYHAGANYGHPNYGARPYHYGYGYGGLYGGAYWPGYASVYQPYWYGSYPFYDYAPATPYYAPVTASYVAPPVANASAMVEVILPDPQARVWFDGTLTRQTGPDRIFQTAALTTSGTYHIRAAWNVGGQQVTQERIVTVTPNQTAVVDFTRPPGG